MRKTQKLLGTADDTPSVETDIRATFERVWRELDTRDESQTSPGDGCNSVWLECNDELVDSCSVKVLRIG